MNDGRSSLPKGRSDIYGLSSSRRLAVGIFFFVLAVYTLTYVGAFKSNDERALFSGVDSFVKRGDFTVNQIYWDYTHVGMRTTAGDMVPNYEPAQMVAAIPFYVWGRALGAAVQGVLFFGAVIMAAAAALVYLCLLELGYRRRSSVLGALVFAFATMAWPYSRTFFREPLTVLAYLLAIYAALRYRPPAPRSLVWPALAGASLGLALTTKQISIVLIPPLVLLAVVYEWGRPSGKSLVTGDRTGRVGAAVAAIVPLAVFLLLGRLYNAAVLGGVEVFARDIVDYTTNPQLSQSVPERMIRAALGLSISPYKGLLWYSPALILGLVGVIPFLRRRLWEGVAFLMLVGALLLGYSRYNYWSGGVAWGSRYMLPAVPFLVLLAAPVWAWLVGDDAFSRSRLPSEHSALVRRRSGIFRVLDPVLRILTVFLLTVSVLVQVLGIGVDLRTYELRFLLDQAEVWGGIGQAIEALYMRPAYSPVLGHLRLLFSGTQPLDFAWVQWREQGTWALAPVGLLLSLLLVGLAAAGLILIGRRPGRAGPVGGGLALATVLICTLLLTVYRQGDARFDPYGVDRFLKPMTDVLTGVRCDSAGALAKADCDDVLLVPDPNLTDYFLSRLRAPLPWYGLEPRPVDEELMQRLLDRYSVIWLARDRNAATDDAEDRRGWERYLTEHAYKADEQGFGDWARLLRFSAAGRPAEEEAPRQALGEMVLQSVHLGIEGRTASPQGTDPLDDGKVQARAGDTLQVGLEWLAAQKPAANYSVFVQLLDDASQVKAQSDRWPGDGLYPTGTLSAGQMVPDNLALSLDVPPGQYRLIAGLYRNDVEGLPRLTGPAGDSVLLAEVDVQPEP
jgi:Dolichyl-phosphate-mannose-protein mannosyltransferase